MRFNPKYVPNAGRKPIAYPSPMQMNVTAALCWKGTPDMPGPQQTYGAQLEISESIRAGKRHPMAGFDKTMVRERERGASFGWAMNAVRAVKESLLVIWGETPDTSNPMAVHIAETDAQCEADRLQVRVFADLPHATDDEMRQLETLWEIEVARKEAGMLLMVAERLRRAKVSERARRQLGLA